VANKPRWHTYLDTDADSFNLYRSIVGIIVPFPNSLTIGDKLVFSVTSNDVQKVILTATDIDTVVSDINENGNGVIAMKDVGGTNLLIRSKSKIDPRFKLYPCTFATNTSQTPRSILPRTEFNLLANIAFVNTQSDYEYEDVDGYCNDWYRITTIKGANESKPSQAQPVIDADDICVVEGSLADLKSDPVAGVVIKAIIAVPVGTGSYPGHFDNAGLIKKEISTVTDEEGRWSFGVMKSKLVIFQIEDIGYNQAINVPNQPYILFKDLIATNDHYYNPPGEVIP
jgi:hypothetical protein